MKNIIALRGFVGDNGNNIAIGDKISVSDAFAQQLIKAGKAKEIVTYPDSDNAHDNQVVSNHQEQNDENNTILNSDNNDIHYQDNVTDIDAQNDDDEVVDDQNVANIDNLDTQNDTNTVQSDDVQAEQQDNKSNAVIIQKNTAGKK